MSRTLRIAALALLMIAVIAGMVAIYARDLRTGAEITLKTEPVDPRSLFLGHYAILGYAINRLDGALFGDECYEPNDVIFVTLAPDGAGDWRAVAAGKNMPSDGFSDGRATLRGRVSWHSECPRPDPAPTDAHGAASAPDASGPVPGAREEAPPRPALTEAMVSYGIEQYFASPEAARRLEELARRRPAEGEEALAPLEIVLSVPRSGRALIKGVVIDGVKTYDQTIW